MTLKQNGPQPHPSTWVCPRLTHTSREGSSPGAALGHLVAPSWPRCRHRGGPFHPHVGRDWGIRGPQHGPRQTDTDKILPLCRHMQSDSTFVGREGSSPRSSVGQDVTPKLTFAQGSFQA